MKRDNAVSQKPGGRHDRLLKLLILSIFIGALVAFFAFGGNEYLHLETVKRHRDALQAFVAAHYALSLLIAFLVYAAATAFSLPVAIVLSLTIGFLFGRWVGTALVVMAATLGATLLFVAARYLFADAARRRLGAVGKRINAGFTKNAFLYLLFLRLVPLFPFFLVNLAPAFTTIPVYTFVLATAIGIIPGTFVFVNLGQALASIDSLKGLVSPELIGSLLLLGMLAIVPIVVQKIRARQATVPLDR
ncbi:MAG TPA: TVP38/TMEM64 family protein [Casimicrobiaceae bacterium]|jgi:uncharacterized membrane protein YdjX (TVP38/TMEM64 family)